MVQPALARTLRIAGIGAVVNQAGSCAWVACALISARIGRPSRFGQRAPGQDQRGGAVGIGRGARRRDRPVGPEGGLQRGNFFGRDFERVLVAGDRPVAALGGNRDRRDFGGEGAVFDRLFGARQGLDRIGVLFGAAELIGLRRRLAEIAHRAAAFIGVFEAVEQHMVDDAVMAHAIAAARLGEQIGRVRHRFHAAGDDDLGRSRQNEIMGEHGRLHAGAADLVDGGRARGVGQSGASGRLARGRLALAGRQDAAHQRLVDALRRELGAFERGADHMGAERRRGKPAQFAEEPAERRAHGGDDDDGIGVGHGIAPRVSTPAFEACAGALFIA